VNTAALQQNASETCTKNGKLSFVGAIVSKRLPRTGAPDRRLLHPRIKPRMSLAGAAQTAIDIS
jgi:hypothetical protein